jgi:hypothetical protein
MGQPARELSGREVSARQSQGCTLFVDDSLLVKKNTDMNTWEQ